MQLHKYIACRWAVRKGLPIKCITLILIKINGIIFIESKEIPNFQNNYKEKIAIMLLYEKSMYVYSMQGLE